MEEGLAGGREGIVFPFEERIELHIVSMLKNGDDGHRVFEVECTGHVVRLSEDLPDPELDPRTDVVIRRADAQSPDYALRIARGDGTRVPVAVKLPIELPRMVLKVYSGTHEEKGSFSGSAQVNGVLCWGNRPSGEAGDYGFELGTWSLSQYVPGVDLDVYLAREAGEGLDPALAWADRCFCLAGVADRLAEMRSAQGGWVHGDVKPRNIVVRPITEGGVRSARSVELIDNDTLVYLPIGYGDVVTPAFARGCTPSFAAPEVLLEGLVERASDIWSFGVLVHDALAGSLPFACSDCGSKKAWEALHRAGAEPQLDEGLPYEVRLLVRKCLDTSSMRRPDPSWLAAQLREFATRPPEGYLPKPLDVRIATTIVLSDGWRARLLPGKPVDPFAPAYFPA